MTEKRFKFRLDSVKRVAEIRKRLADQKLVQQQAELALARHKELARISSYEIRAQGMAPVSDLDSFRRDRDSMSRHAQAAADAEGARIEAEIKLLEAREQWLTESRKARSLDRLESRHRAAHAMVAARAAQRSLDDLAQLRRSRA